MSKGRLGEYGGQYIPETLMPAVQEVEEAYNKYSKDPEFIWQKKWAKPVSSQKPVPDSTVLQLLPLLL